MASLPDRQLLRPIWAHRAVRVLALGVAVAALVAAAAAYLPGGVDWRETYRPAALAVLSGRSPLTVPSFYIAPWGILPLLPFAPLPVDVGRGFLFVLGFAAYGYTAYKLGARPVALIAFLLSPPVAHGLVNANIDWLPLLGVVLPPPIGLLLVVIKPQIGIGVALFWVVEAARRGGVKDVVRLVWPLALALVASLAVFGPWPLRFRDALATGVGFNASLWPSTLPVGLVLLAAAIHRRKINYAMAAAPCLSPYVLLHAWVGALAALAAQPVEMVAAVVGLWVLVVYRAFTGAL